MLIDTHSHIYLEQFDDDRGIVIENALKSGIEKIVLPNIDSSSIKQMNDTYNLNPDIFEMAIGLHPTSVEGNYQNELDAIFNNFDLTRYIAIGEIGIDLYWDKTFYKQQQIVFDFQLSFAKENKLPVIIHSRNSFDEIIDVMKPHFGSGLTGVFHCFPGNSEQAKLVINKGFYIGIGGVLTYKKSNMPEVVRNIPMDRILLETDAPYLSPVPKRGKRNEPAYVNYIAEHLSGLIGRDFDEVCSKTTQNAKDLFNL